MSDHAVLYRQQAKHFRECAKDWTRFDIETLLDLARHFEEMADKAERRARKSGAKAVRPQSQLRRNDGRKWTTGRVKTRVEPELRAE